MGQNHRRNPRQAFIAITEIASIIEEVDSESCVIKMRDGRELFVCHDSGICYEKIEDRLTRHRENPFVEFQIS